MKFAFGGRTATKTNTKEGSHSPLSFELPLSVTESLIGIFLTRVNLVLRVRIRQYDIIYEVIFYKQGLRRSSNSYCLSTFGSN